MKIKAIKTQIKQQTSVVSATNMTWKFENKMNWPMDKYDRLHRSIWCSSGSNFAFKLDQLSTFFSLEYEPHQIQLV